MIAHVRVRWGECDPAGIAFYPRFFEWTDACSGRLHELLGVKRAGGAQLHGLPLVGVTAEFLAPAVAGDELEVRAWVVSVGRTSLGLRYEFVRVTDGVVLARTTERRVHVTRDPLGAMKPAPLSDAMRDALAPHVDAPATTPP